MRRHLNHPRIHLTSLRYEKVVGALNKQLDELRAELVSIEKPTQSAPESQTNISDLYEDQGRQLVEAQDRHVTNEIYVTELRHRVSKLTERNSSSEVCTSTSSRHSSTEDHR